MACNCCGGTDCNCNVSDSSSETGKLISNFGYSLIGTLYWVHRPYPQAMQNLKYNKYFGYLPSNAIISTNPPYSANCPGLLFDTSTESRAGWTRDGWGDVITKLPLVIYHWDGDSTYGGTGVFPVDGFIVSKIEFKTEFDNINKMCLLYGRIKTGNEKTGDFNWIDPDIGWVLIDSTKMSKIGHVGNKVVQLPFAFGGGVTGVELIFRCASFPTIDTCLAEFSGQASYFSNVALCEDKGCKTNMYTNQYNGLTTINYKNIPADAGESCKSQIIKTVATFANSTILLNQYNSRSVQSAPGSDCYVEIQSAGDTSGLNPDLCFGKLYSIVKDQDGNDVIVPVMTGLAGHSIFLNDPFILNVTSLDEVTFVGIWMNSVVNETLTIDCSGECSLVERTPGITISVGSVTITKT